MFFYQSEQFIYLLFKGTVYVTLKYVFLNFFVILFPSLINNLDKIRLGGQNARNVG